MSYPIDWRATKENGISVRNSPVSSLSGLSSLLLSSDGTEWDAVDPTVRKSASLFIRNGAHERGFSSGRLRTLLRRNAVTLQTEAWCGIYIMSDREGIGTRVDPGRIRYEITDKDGNIRLIKYTNFLPTTLATSSVSFDPHIIYGFQVQWEYVSATNRVTIKVYRSPLGNFSSLVKIIDYDDSDSPHHLAVTEGFFVQTQTPSGDDTPVIISYSFDTTSVYQTTKL